MSIADRLRNEGREEARQEEQEKAKQRTYAQVLTSLSLGLNIDVISQITGLSPTEIEAIH